MSIYRNSALATATRTPLGAIDGGGGGVSADSSGGTTDMYPLSAIAIAAMLAGPLMSVYRNGASMTATRSPPGTINGGGG